jgi:hypothetical protein
VIKTKKVQVIQVFFRERVIKVDVGLVGEMVADG